MSRGIRRACVRWHLLVVAAAPLACLSDLGVPADAEVGCSEAEPTCPVPLVCATAAGRCVDPALVNLDAITLEVDGPPAHPRMSRVAPFDTNTVGLALSRRPVKLAGDIDGQPADCSLADDGRAGTCAWTTPTGADGARTLVVTAADELGAAVAARVPFEVDTTAPSLMQELVAFQLEPAVDNPRLLDGVSSMTIGTTLRVVLVFDEPVLSDAVVSLADVTFNAAVAASAPTNTVGRVYVDSGEIRDGSYPLVVRAEDAVGNGSQLITDATVLVDHVPPVGPDVESDVIVLHRAPWGEVVQQATGRFPHEPQVQVIGAAGATALDVRRVRAFIDGRIVGDAIADDDGSFVLPLLAGDARRVSLRAFDDAGNGSAEVPVHYVEWVGAFGGKVPGSVFENPHVVSTVRELGLALQAHPMTEAPNPDALVLADGSAIEAAVGRTWREIKNGVALPPRTRFGLVWDTTRDVAVVSGGVLGDTARASDTFELSGGAWVPRALVSPPPRSDAAAAFDARRGRTVIFGGLTTGGAVDETWEFDGVTWVERPVHGPAARFDAAMAYDLDTGLVVLFGGTDAAQTDLDDTWTYDGISWTQLGGDGLNAPPARARASLAYDAEHQRMVLFGGEGQQQADSPFTSVPLDDVWTLDDGTWTATPTTGGPRGALPMVFEPATGAMLVVGDSAPGSELTRGTMQVWRLDGDVWTLVSDGQLPFEDRSGHRLVTDAFRAQVVLVGGAVEEEGIVSGILPVSGDAWQYDGFTWRELARPILALPDFAPAGAAYDPITQRVLSVAGEFAGAGVATVSDTYAFDEDNWTLVTTPTAPGFGAQGCLGQLSGQLAFLQSELAVWNGADWSMRPGPGQQILTCAATEDENGFLLVNWMFFAGELLFQTLLYDGESWAVVCDESTGASCPHPGPMGFDSSRQAVIAVDARGTWRWDGSSWTLLGLPQSPSVRETDDMVFDRARGNLVLLDSAGALQPWEFDGTGWRTLSLAASPPGRTRMAVAYDEENHRVMFAGGLVGGQTNGETWVLSEAGRPAVLLRFVLAAAGRADGVLESVELRARAGGRGPGGDGVEVLAWNHGRFEPLTSLNASLEAQGDLVARVEGADVATFPSGLDESLVFAVTPTSAGDNGTNSTVRVDEATVVVRYRLP